MLHPKVSVYTDDRTLEELILARINDLVKQLNPNNKVSKQTDQKAKLTPRFLKDNGLISVQRPFLVNCFPQIGIEDPFPNDDLTVIGSVDDDDCKIAQKHTDLIYDAGRYQDEFSPLCIYIPRKELMLKMMRACIDVKLES